MYPTYEQRQALKYYKIRLLRSDIRTFSYKRLKQEFSTADGKRIVKARLIRSIIYQVVIWIKRGKFPPIEGNLRSLYYIHIKPVFSKFPEDALGKFDPYKEMLDAMELFITELKFFKYRDLEIIDTDWENRWYTDGRNPHILVYAEKDGFIRVLQEFREEYGVTAVALGGSPSHMGSEYMVEQMRKRIESLEPLTLFNIVDYDPSGYFIQEAFERQLKNQGMKIELSIPLILPEYYTNEEIDMFKFSVPSEYPRRVESWMQETQGILGEPWGLEADSMPKSKLRELFRQKIFPYLRNQ